MYKVIKLIVFYCIYVNLGLNPRQVKFWLKEDFRHIVKRKKSWNGEKKIAKFPKESEHLFFASKALISKNIHSGRFWASGKFSTKNRFFILIDSKWSPNNLLIHENPLIKRCTISMCFSVSILKFQMD